MSALETSQAELEALEREPQRPIKKKTPQSDSNTKPRDELGRFTRLKKPKK